MTLHMKSKNLMVAMILMLSATAAQAQQHIQQAFDALLNEKGIEKKTQHTLEKNPDTGKREGEMDLYDFTIPSPTSRHHQLIKDIEQAFEIDKENAYSLNSGTYGHPALLAVGNGNSSSVGLGNIKGSQYLYACFLDKDDPEKKCRYAYAMEWSEKDKKITVRLAKTYATIPKYREGRRSSYKININGQDLDIPEVFEGSLNYNGSEAWLTKFNTFRTLFMKKSDGAAANSWATQIYKLCKDAQSLDDAEKNLVATEIKKLKAKTEDEFIQQLFDLSIEQLKK